MRLARRCRSPSGHKLCASSPTCCVISRRSIRGPPRGTKPGGQCNGRRPWALSAMPLFHFDVRYDDRPWSEDATGSELDGVAEARKEAFELARELAKDQLGRTREITTQFKDGTPEPIMSLRVSLR